MLSVEDLERALASIDVEAPVRFDEVTGSTNATALRLAEEGAPEWTLVGAGHQTLGRGRVGRSWVDRPGGALLFSVVLRPTHGPQASGLIPLLAGASMAEAATASIGEGGGAVVCEWPNDLLLEGGKVGGVLVEAAVDDGAIRHAVVGIGVNLLVPEGEPRARALGAVDPGGLLVGFLGAFAPRYRMQTSAFGSAVLEAWRSVSITLGRDVEIVRLDGDVVRGTAIDVDRRGALVVRTDDGGEVAVMSGEVRRAEADPRRGR